MSVDCEVPTQISMNGRPVSPALVMKLRALTRLVVEVDSSTSRVHGPPALVGYTHPSTVMSPPRERVFADVKPELLNCAAMRVSPCACPTAFPP